MDKLENALHMALLAHQATHADTALHQVMHNVAIRMVQTLRGGGRVLFCGNGGSAADAQHLAAELSGRFYSDRPALDADALHANSSYLTAVANDYGYDCVFERLLRARARAGDVLVGLSTSGNSANVVQAFQAAREMGVVTVGFTGERPGRMEALSDLLIRVPATITTRIQELHILVGHTICELVEDAMFPATQS